MPNEIPFNMLTVTGSKYELVWECPDVLSTDYISEMMVEFDTSPYSLVCVIMGGKYLGGDFDSSRTYLLINEQELPLDTYMVATDSSQSFFGTRYRTVKMLKNGLLFGQTYDYYGETTELTCNPYRIYGIR